MTNSEKAKVILEGLDKVLNVNWNFKQQYLNSISQSLQEIDKQEAVPDYIDQSKFTYLLMTTVTCPVCGEENRHEVYEDDETKETFKECDNYQCRHISRW